MDLLRPVHRHTQTHLNQYLGKIEEILDADVLAIFSPMWSGLENIVKNAVELFQDRKDRITIVLDTTGGYVEVVERMVYVIRKHYAEVYFLVPDRAMSAGTVFVMAGDQIFMNYSSCLGPIDPQIEKGEKFVTGAPVTPEEKRERAEDIAEALSDHERWRSHGRMISIDTLTSRSEGIHLKIEKIEDNPDLASALDDYVGLLKDYMQREQLGLFVHTREYF